MTLTEKQARALRLGDKPIYDQTCTGLSLHPTEKGAKWIYRFTSPITGKRRDAGLGAYPSNSIAEARDKAQAMRKLVTNGADPIERQKEDLLAMQAAVAALTFEQAAREVHGELKPGWKNAKHATQWINTLETFVFPKFGDKKLGSITPKDCADALRPIWLTKAETASRVRQRIHAVMQWAWAHGHITSNPVAVVDHLLPKQNAKVQHQRKREFTST